jgi:hypothetical protein
MAAAWGGWRLGLEGVLLVATEFSELPLEERMKAYHEQALKALKAAEASASKTRREHFLFIAVQWEEMAKDIERKLKNAKGR